MLIHTKFLLSREIGGQRALSTPNSEGFKINMKNPTMVLFAIVGL